MSEDEHEGPSLLELGSDFEDPVDDLEEQENRIESFTDDENESVALHKVRQAVRRYGKEGNGLTVSEIEEITDLAPKTIRRHLDTLRHLREVYRQKRNNNFYLYYPNGKPLHAFGKERIEDGETILDLQLAEGRHGEYFLHLTEKRYSLMEGETTEGAIIFPLTAVDELVDSLEQFAEEVRDNDE